MATRRYAKGEQKRQEILEVALALIAEHGFRKSTLKEIAGAVGLSNAGVLHYFESKEELFAEVLRMRDAIPERDPGAPYAMAEYLDVIEYNAGVPGLVRLFSSLSAEAVDVEHGAHEFFVERYDDARRLLAEAVEGEIAAGRLADHIDASRLAVVLIALADGLQVQWLLDDDVDMAGHLRYFLELLRPA